MSTDTDVAILGGGCAGLSLAVALSQHAPKLRVAIIEPRAYYERDRTWCYWNAEPHPFAVGVTHRWDSWRVRHAGVEARQQSGQYRYECLPADRFYDIARTTLQRAGHELCLSTRVQSLDEMESCCKINTDRGSLRARWIFDSRPTVSEGVYPLLEQRFTGWHVRTARPCFDPSVVDLMDFQPDAERDRTAFLYVLPFSPTEALVEATYLDLPELAPPRAEALINAYLARLQAGQVEVLYREAGILPMGSLPKCRLARGRVHDIGARGGRIKASSGYAFLRIQRQSTGIAKSLASGRLPARLEPEVYGLLDRIFLQAIRRDPHRAPTYFIALFQRLSPDLLVRFMSETASPSEILQVMLALPKLDFLHAAFSVGCSA